MDAHAWFLRVCDAFHCFTCVHLDIAKYDYPRTPPYPPFHFRLVCSPFFLLSLSLMLMLRAFFMIRC